MIFFCVQYARNARLLLAIDWFYVAANDRDSTLLRVFSVRTVRSLLYCIVNAESTFRFFVVFSISWWNVRVAKEDCVFRRDSLVRRDSKYHERFTRSTRYENECTVASAKVLRRYCREIPPVRENFTPSLRHCVSASADFAMTRAASDVTSATFDTRIASVFPGISKRLYRYRRNILFYYLYPYNVR